MCYYIKRSWRASSMKRTFRIIATLSFVPIMLSACTGNTWNNNHETPSSEEATYQVEWLNDNGSVLAIEYYKEGEIPSYKGQTPKKESDAYNQYFFDGWRPEIVPVTRDCMYYAKYQSVAKQYTVTWNYNGTVTSQVYRGGETPVYPYATDPIDEPGSIQYFQEWQPSIAPVINDVTYVAQFRGVVKEFTITWLDMNDKVLDTEIYNYGQTPVFKYQVPDVIDDRYVYEFDNKWYPDIQDVTGDMTYKAKYVSRERLFTVSWCNEDGTTIEVDENVPYGTIPSFDSYSALVPPAGSHPGHSYTLMTGWTTSSTPYWEPITGDVTFYANYDYFVRVHFMCFTTEWKSYPVMWGDTPQYYDDWGTPEYYGEPGYVYNFMGWEEEFEPVYQEVWYHAVFEIMPKTLTVTWCNVDGSVVEFDGAVPYGSTPEYNGPYLEAPSSTCPGHSYTLQTGWSSDNGSLYYEPVYEDTVFTATFDYFVVLHFMVDGQLLCNDAIKWGEMAGYPSDQPTPTKIDTEPGYEYEFIGWDVEFAYVFEETTYNAVFQETYVGG